MVDISAAAGNGRPVCSQKILFILTQRRQGAKIIFILIICFASLGLGARQIILKFHISETVKSSFPAVNMIRTG